MGYLLTFVLLFFCATVRAEIFQVSQDGGSGTNNIDWLNTDGNWANPKQAGKVGPGDTVTLNGIITNAIIVRASGSAGSIITLSFAPGAAIAMPYFTNASDLSAIYGSSKSYIKIDGGANGSVYCTDNGSPVTSTPPGTNTYQVESLGIHFVNGGTDLEVCNLVVGPIYSRVPYSNDKSLNSGGANSGIIASGYSNFSVHGCTVHDCRTGIGEGILGTLTATNVQFYSNTMYHVAQGYAIGISPAASYGATNIALHHNSFNANTNWMDDGAGYYHSGGIHIYGGSETARVQDIQIYDNSFGPSIANCTTSFVFTESPVDNVSVWNNVFSVSAFPSGGNGLIFVKSWTTRIDRHVSIYHNTFVNYGTESGKALDIEEPNVDIRNNLVSSVAMPVYTPYADSSIATCDYNLYFCTNASYPFFEYLSVYGYSWTQWKGLGFDTHSPASPHTQNPLLTSIFRLQEGSPAINAGTPLADSYLVDAAGNSRSNSWDIGAYEYGSSANPPSISLSSDASTYLSNSVITLTATVTPGTGTVTNVFFWSGASQIGSDSSSTYGMTLTTNAGSYNLTASVWDDNGLSATSSVVSITVTNAPTPAPPQLLLWKKGN